MEGRAPATSATSPYSNLSLCRSRESLPGRGATKLAKEGCLSHGLKVTGKSKGDTIAEFLQVRCRPRVQMLSCSSKSFCHKLQGIRNNETSGKVLWLQWKPHLMPVSSCCVPHSQLWRIPWQQIVERHSGFQAAPWSTDLGQGCNTKNFETLPEKP